MADKKQSLWSYLKDSFVDTFSPKRMRDKTVSTISNVYTWVWNILDWKPWWENNTTFEEVTKWISRDKKAESVRMPEPTLNEVASVETPRNNSILPDISTPSVNVNWNDEQWQTDIAMDENWDVDKKLREMPKAEESILWNLELAEKDKTMEAIDRAETEGAVETWRSIYNSILKFFNNTIPDWIANQFEDSEIQSKEKILAIKYDPASKNITRLVINKPHWLLQDTADAFFNRWENNEEIFRNLYYEYDATLDAIANSWLDERTQLALANVAKEEFRKTVNDKKLIKAMEDDAYSDGLIWKSQNSKRFWRRKDQFTDEQLERLAKAKDIKEWAYEVNADEFDAFLDVYEKNNELESFRNVSKSESETRVSVKIDEEQIANIQSTQQKQILSRPTELINSLVESWKISSDVGNEIENNSIGVIRDAVSQMHLYLDSPLAYYAAVREKENRWLPLTDWERAILWYGPQLEKVMNSYTSALEEWLYKSIESWINNWELTKVIDQINGLSIKDFFKDKVEESLIQAWWLSLNANESVIDWFQLLNNNFSHLFRQGKWNWLRQTWTEWQRILWGAWYMAWELGSMLFRTGVEWIENIFWTNHRVSEYVWADFSKWMMLTTDESARWRLAKQYWLLALENIPELAWEIYLMKWTWLFGKGSKVKDALKKTMEATKKSSSISSMISKAKRAVGSARKQWAKNYIKNMAKEVWKDLPERTKAIIDIGERMIQRVVRDQTIDWLASYYDTEAYSTPSFLLSVWLTWLTEIWFETLLGDAQLWKMFTNKLRWLPSTAGTWWQIMKMLEDSPEIWKRLEDIYWPTSRNFLTYKVLARDKGLSEIEDILSIAYKEMSPEWQEAMRKFSKDVAIQKLNELNAIDWNSEYWKRLRALVDARSTNIWDLWKYLLWIPWEVSVWWFTSSILFKEWADAATQTRYIKKWYDIVLDNIDWQFRSKLQQWFKDTDIYQIWKLKWYEEVIKNWKVNENYFVKEWDKYILNGDGAKYLWLDVSEYTEAMMREDALRAQAENTNAFLNENIKEFAKWKWISEWTINRLASSWTFESMVRELERVTCR